MSDSIYDVKPNRIYSALSNTFDVDNVVEQSALVPVVTTEKPEDNTATADAAAVRDTMYSLLKKGEESFDELKRIAIAEESPRAFEIMNNMLGTIADIASKLMDVHEKVARIKAPKGKEVVEGNTTINNNAVFVGTTSELQDIIKKINQH